MRPTRAAVRQQARRMARAMADELVNFLERHGFWDEPTPSAQPQQRARRSVAALQTVCAAALRLCRQAKRPLAISEIADALGLPRREVTHPLALLVEQGKLARSGSRRGARYGLPAREKTQRPPPKAVRPRAPRTGRGG